MSETIAHTRKNQMPSISICVPQYNRIEFLLESLKIIAKQQYPHMEIVISDDCSTDDTEEQITKIVASYKFPLIYKKHTKNQGYDRNLRSAIEFSTGDYAFVLGNDDTLNPAFDIADLARFLAEADYPDVGFVNFQEASSGQIIRRAEKTGVLGSGSNVAFKYYSCFSFVGGLIFKKSTFTQHNTSKSDGSIYSQIYLACLIVASGGTLFSIAHSLVIKDVLPEKQDRKSFKDTIARKWKDYRRVDGGLHAVIHVLISAFRDAGAYTESIGYGAFRKIYTTTFPYWLMEYRRCGAFPEAVGLVDGMRPWKVRDIENLNLTNRIRVTIRYFISGIAGLITPILIYDWFVRKVLKRG